MPEHPASTTNSQHWQQICPGEAGGTQFGAQLADHPRQGRPSGARRTTAGTEAAAAAP